MSDPNIKSSTTLSPFQEIIEGMLGGGFGFGPGQIGKLFADDFFESKLGKFDKGPFFEEGAANEFLQNLRNAPGKSSAALNELLSGAPQDISGLKRSLETDAFRRFDRFAAPRIQSQFARHGASFGSRRGEAVGRSLGDLQSRLSSQIGGLQTGLIESARNRQLQATSIPLQQALGQIGGFQALRGGRLGEQGFRLNQRRQGLAEILAPFGVAQGFLGRGSQALSASPNTTSQYLQGFGTLLGAGGGLGGGGGKSPSTPGGGNTLGAGSGSFGSGGLSGFGGGGGGK